MFKRLKQAWEQSQQRLRDEDFRKCVLLTAQIANRLLDQPNEDDGAAIQRLRNHNGESLFLLSEAVTLRVAFEQAQRTVDDVRAAFKGLTEVQREAMEVVLRHLTVASNLPRGPVGWQVARELAAKSLGDKPQA